MSQIRTKRNLTRNERRVLALVAASLRQVGENVGRLSPMPGRHEVEAVFRDLETNLEGSIRTHLETQPSLE